MVLHSLRQHKDVENLNCAAKANGKGARILSSVLYGMQSVVVYFFPYLQIVLLFCDQIDNWKILPRAPLSCVKEHAVCEQ